MMSLSTLIESWLRAVIIFVEKMKVGMCFRRPAGYFAASERAASEISLP